jgi:hypothetical protein
VLAKARCGEVNRLAVTMNAASLARGSRAATTLSHLDSGSLAGAQNHDGVTPGRALASLIKRFRHCHMSAGSPTRTLSPPLTRLDPIATRSLGRGGGSLASSASWLLTR